MKRGNEKNIPPVFYLGKKLNFGMVTSLLTSNLHRTAHFEPRFGENRSSISTRKSASIFFSMIQQIDCTGTKIVYANTQTEKSAFRPDVCYKYITILQINKDVTREREGESHKPEHMILLSALSA